MTDRMAGLAGALRRRRGRPGWAERVAPILGAVLLPLGTTLILLGWYGSARTPRLAEQIPYLISGGLLGVAMVCAGGFLFCGHLLARVGRANAERDERALALLRRIEAGINRMAPGGEVGLDGMLVATGAGRLLHLPSCAVVAGRTDLRVLPGNAAGYERCPACQPTRTSA